MTLPTLQPEVIAALRSAGATEEIIAAAVKASGELRTPTQAVGRASTPMRPSGPGSTASARSVTKLG
jgi:hypothetical protein